MNQWQRYSLFLPHEIITPVFYFGKMNWVFKSLSKATMALNFLPCLLLKPLRTPVLPFVISSFISSSVRSLPAFCRKMGKPHSLLSQRTTLWKNCIFPVPHFGQVHSDSLCPKIFWHESIRFASPLLSRPCSRQMFPIRSVRESIPKYTDCFRPDCFSLGSERFSVISVSCRTECGW